METLFHFVFMLIKIAILALVYSFLVISILSIIEKFRPTAFLKRVSSGRKQYYFLFAFAIATGLFFYSFTYWGNHGLGDSAQIPIGHWETIGNINWTEYGYLEERKSREGFDITMTKFKVTDGKLCGNYDSWFYRFAFSHFIYDLKSDQLIEFRAEGKYNDYAHQNGLPQASELLSFKQNYNDHWQEFRFILLP